MSTLESVFDRLEKLMIDDEQCDFISLISKAILDGTKPQEVYNPHKAYLKKIFAEIENLSAIIKLNSEILISVKQKKLLQKCFHVVAVLGFSFVLLPGLGIKLSQRCLSASSLPLLDLNDEQKYDILTECTCFFTEAYKVSIFKDIIVSYHISDYLAALIQLSFAPLKKPGVYKDFIMTQEMWENLNADKKNYLILYNDFVANCFQPILMKELIMLQSVKNPKPPLFVKRVIAKELSQRLIAPHGLLNLIRCFTETYDTDTGLEWKKIDTICKIVKEKHGNNSHEDYLNNMCNQLTEILKLSNTHYLSTAIACILALNEKYPQRECIQSLIKQVFHSFNYENFHSNSYLPGTLILTPQDIEHKINILHASIDGTKTDSLITLLIPNLLILFLLGMKCNKNRELKIKIQDIIIKCMEELNETDVCRTVDMFIFGQNNTILNIDMDEYDSGIGIKCTRSEFQYPRKEAVVYFLHLFNMLTNQNLITLIFKALLQKLINITMDRHKVERKNVLENEEEPSIDDIDEQYAIILQLLSEMSLSAKVTSILKNKPSTVLNFVENFIKSDIDNNQECVTISLILLNIVLCNTKRDDLDNKFLDLLPILKRMALDKSNVNRLLCEEALSLINSDEYKKSDTPYEQALSNVFDNLLPIRAHGIIELTKLITAKDPETMSKKHYVLLLFQEQLKDPDSYIYLSAINGIASLCLHCTEDVLEVLCKEFLKSSSSQHLETKEDLNKNSELRMKIGDIIVKVTKRLGEMAIVHKTTLLNTMLCACRDEDPLIRTSALSNLAEIALVLHYKIGSIIYEVLLCLWSIIETDKAIECRRAAVMVISSLIKGLGKDHLLQLTDNLLPIYRTLKSLYSDAGEDAVMRLHAQIALEELDDIVRGILFGEVKLEKKIYVLDTPEDLLK